MLKPWVTRRSETMRFSCRRPSAIKSCAVATTVQGAGSDSSNVAHGDLGAGVAEAECFLPVAFHYTAADTAIVWSCWAKVGPLGCNNNAIAGPSGHHTPNGTVFGINVGSEQVPTTYVNCVGNQLGDALVFGHWYEIRVVVNFSVAGGIATLMYRDLTLGQPAFTVDALLRNVNLGLGTDVSGSFPFLQAYLRVDDQCAGVCYVDRLHIGAPGSSTAAVGPDAPASRWALAVAPDPARVAGPASVRFSLPGRSHVRITAFDTNGRRVGTLADEELAAGAYERRWNVRGDRGEPLGAGLYFVRLDAGAHVAVSKLVIVR